MGHKYRSYMRNMSVRLVSLNVLSPGRCDMDTDKQTSMHWHYLAHRILTDGKQCENIDKKI